MTLSIADRFSKAQVHVIQVIQVIHVHVFNRIDTVHVHVQVIQLH